MHTEIKKRAEMLAKEAQKVHYAIEQHNIHLGTLEQQTEKVEQKSKILSNKLLRTVKEMQKDGRNTIIIALTLTAIMLILYLV
ncbi:uncharacterized protein NEMAJ01_0510 [Nematocida major]|uniref:uncharacterized protein n=1 Tax=Nematocida major TaxID=1912982 RepID=UPI0020087A9B|nr:uncharacterized protein NEMAJ01_0510 [Nematocida major]KAH9385614.1 hypothetical protein NEMAJ01_0510 [Nematocida major]